MSRSELRVPGDRTGGLGEVIATWSLWVVLLAVLAITYYRLDPTELYHVSGTGVAGAASRVLVATNFPVSLVAIAVVLLALDGSTAPWRWVGGAAVALCAVTAWPGVVDEADLDARPINAVPALGVALAVVVTAMAATGGRWGFGSRRPLDRVRLLVALVVLALSVPWIVADLGFFVPEGVFIAERPIAGTDGTVLPAVHLGHHHGLDGALLVITALLLSRLRPTDPTLAAASGLYLALMFAYGIVNAGQDFWNEQFFKRGWTDWSIPSPTKPTLTPIWLVVVGLTVATYLVGRWERSVERQRAGPFAPGGEARTVTGSGTGGGLRAPDTVVPIAGFPRGLGPGGLRPR